MTATTLLVGPLYTARPFTFHPIHPYDADVTRMYTVSGKKNIQNIIDCHLKKRYPILIIFGTIISGTTGHQMTVQYSTSSNVCFCTTWGYEPMKYKLK